MSASGDEERVGTRTRCVGNTISASHEQAPLALFIYREVYYNRIRRHSTLAYVSPLVYEQRHWQQAKQNVWRRTFLLL